MSLTDTAATFTDCDFTDATAGSLPFAQRHVLAVDLPMRHAGQRRIALQVESVGPVNAPAIWVAGGISAGRHVAANALDPSAGWWQDAVGAGRGLDPQNQRLLSFDWVGAAGDLDSPIDTVDQAKAIALALDALGIRQLQAFVGASYGGMVALQFAALHPDRVAQLVVLSAAHRPHPFASAYRSLQRQVVALGQLQCADELGLSLARQLAMLSYRTPEEFGERFDQPVNLERGRARCAAEDYLQSCGQRYVAKWNSTAFLRLSESIDLHAVDPAAVRVPTSLFAVEQDWLSPPAELELLAAGIQAPTRLSRIASRYGHDAFLKETDAVDTVLRTALCC